MPSRSVIKILQDEILHVNISSVMGEKNEKIFHKNTKHDDLISNVKN